MASDHTKQPAKPTPLPSWGRPFAIATAIVFFISSVFPVAAGLTKDTASFSAWWGVLDVGIAFLLAIMAFAIYGLGRSRVNEQIELATYHAYRILIHGIFLLILIFFLWGDQIVWINSLPGIAWRVWLLLYTLPEWISVMRMGVNHSKS